MRSNLHARRLRALSQATTLVAVGVFSVGCSSDASRFGEVLTTATSMTSNQHSILKKTSSASQAFPDDVNESSLAAAQRTGIQIVKRKATAYATPAIASASSPVTRAVVQSQLPNLPSASNLVQAPSRQSIANTIARQAPQTVRPAVTRTAAGNLVLQPRTTTRAPLRLSSVDRATTGSVRQPAPLAVARERAVQTAAVNQPYPGDAPAKAGWTKAGGTWVNVRPGETLYNLSRRYGVPVNAIKSANNIQDANSVASGARVLIPTYTFGSSAPISAPDSDPVTKASRSSRGFQGEVRTGRLTIPTYRTPGGNSYQTVASNTVRQPNTTGFDTVTTGSVRSTSGGNSHQVKSGETLYGISLKYGVSASAIQSANNMSGTGVQFGQKLIIPSGNNNVVARRTLDPTQYDTTTTGSIPRSAKNSATVPSRRAAQPGAAKNRITGSITKRSAEKVATPKATSAGAFRWPARGRIVSKFGERINSGSNDGIDISVPVGTPVKASENGTVIYSGSELEDFGRLVLLSHSNGWVSAYAHASSTLVKRGDKVRRGQVIAKSGRSGNATSPKLHFELRKNSTPVNPLQHLSKN